MPKLTEDWLITEYRKAAEAYGQTPTSPSWTGNRKHLRNHLATVKASEFLTWSTVHKALWVGDIPVVRHKYKILKRSEYPRYLPTHPKFGKPTFANYDGQMVDPNLVNQAFYLYQLEQRLQLRIEQLSTIVEFGGGYGALAYLCYQLGFRGRYHIYDLPELSLLQQFYLSNIIPDYEKVFNFAIITSDEIYPLAKPNLFIALHSISETPLALRNKFTARMHPDAYFMAYIPTFDKVDNSSYFKNLRVFQDGFSWGIAADDIDRRVILMWGKQ